MNGPKRSTQWVLAASAAVALIMVLGVSIAPAVQSLRSGTDGSASSGFVPFAVTIGNPTPSQPAADIGQAISFAAPTPTGGTGPYTLIWGWDTNLGCTPPTGTTISCDPTNFGSLEVDLEACDSTLVCSSGSSIFYPVYSDPTTSLPVGTLSEIDVGQVVTFSTSPSGGLGPYTYYWFDDFPLGDCPPSGTNSLTCTPTASSTFIVGVDVFDANGKEGGGSTISYTVDPALTTTTPVAVPGSIDLGQSVTFSTTTSGGLAPYSWAWFETLGITIPCTETDTATTSSVDCASASAGSTDVFVDVSDANGNQIQSDYLPFTVYAGPTTTVPSPSQPGADVGQTITFSTSPSLGSGFYTTFTWGESSGSLGCALVNAASITCTPTAIGTYQVTVKVTDTNGGSSSYETSAGLLVSSEPTASGPVPELPVASQPSADVGQLIQFSSAVIGGLAPYTYVWYGLPTGCVTSSNDPFSCTPTGTGTFSVYVVVTDANKYVVTSGSLSYTVDPALVVTLAASEHSVDQGQSVTFTATANGGLGPYSYAWNNLPSGCSGTSAVITCDPATSSTSIYVEVTDANDNSVNSGTVAVTVFLDPSIGTPTANHPGADRGELVSFTAAASGGLTPYSYVWYGLPTGCATSNVDPISCTPTGTGTFSVYVVLTDANGWVVTSGTLSFKVSYPLDVDTPTANHNPGHIGQTIVFTVPATTSGKAPYTYTWNGLPGGCVSANAAKITCKPTGPTGTYHISVTSTDANGAVVTGHSLTFRLWKALSSAPAATGGLASNSIAQMRFGE